MTNEMGNTRVDSVTGRGGLATGNNKISIGQVREFDVKNGVWSSYVDRLEMYFLVNQVQQEMKLPILIAVIGDEAYELLANLTSPKKPSEIAYSEVIELLRQHLQPTPSVLAERYRFRQRRQASDENVSCYVAELKRLARYCKFGTNLNENLRDQFVCGLRSDVIRQRLFAENDALTYSNAVTIANSLESAERDAAVVEGKSSTGTAEEAAAGASVYALAGYGGGGDTRSRVRRGASSSRTSSARSGAGGSAGAGGVSRNSCGGCGAADHSYSGCRFRDYVCSMCRRTGHLRRVCPERGGASGRGGYSRGGYSRNGYSRGGYSRGGSGHIPSRVFYNEAEEADIAEDEGEWEEDFHHLCLSDYQPRPRQQSLGGVLRREGNWKCFLLTLMIAGCLGSVVWCNIAEIDRELIDLNTYPIKRTVRESPCDVGYAYIPIAFVLLLYLVYLVECYHSTARIQLARRVDVAAVSARVHAMRTATPRVWWKAICYHYVRRKRQVTRYRNGDAYTTTQVYYERVNTHSANTSFAHACCGQRDASRNLVLDAKTPITKVRFSKGFAFANIEAASEFEDQRSRFFAEHERFDDFMEMREGLDLIGVSSFKEYMVAYRDTDRCPWYSSQLLFWTLSCLLLSWPLRIVIECNTAYVHYTITKIFGTNYELDPSRQLDLDTHLSDTMPPVTATNYEWALADEQSATLCSAPRPTRTLPLSHASTVDSLELFAAIRGNCALVPSYSEAMRIDAAVREEPTDTAENTDLDGVLVDIEAERPNRPNIKAASFDEAPRRPRVTIAETHSSHNISSSARTNEAKQLNRRSWAGVMTTARSARQILEDFRTSNNPVNYQPMPEPDGRTNGEGTLYFSRELSPTCSRDPFGGRAQTTPTDEPPSYEEALKLPALRKLTRSITGTDLAGGPRRAFLRDVLSNRRSCLEGVGVLAGAKVVRLPYSEPGDETPL